MWVSALKIIQKHFSPLATYETATTRQFYHGRTETMRSCTMAATELARAFTNPDSTHKVVHKSFCQFEINL